MGYALFAQRKLVLDNELNYAQLQQTQLSNEQFKLATRSTDLQQQLSSSNASHAGEMAKLYEDLAGAENDDARDQINAEIKQKELEYQQEIDAVNREIYQVSVQENGIEMMVKKMDTVVTALQKQLDAVEQAEGQAIDRATPKFKGVG